MKTMRSKLIIGFLALFFACPLPWANVDNNCTLAQETAALSCSTSHTAAIQTWSYTNSSGITINYSVVRVDGSNLNPTDTEILIPPGKYDVARFTNIKRDASCPITIRADGGLVEFEGEISSTFVLQNCQYVTVDGRVNGQPYNIFIKNAADGQQGLTVYGESSNIEIHDLKIFNPLGFAGIMVKNSPNCHNGVASGYCGEPSSCVKGEDIYIHDVYIHHNYIEHTGGEGIYVGDTRFLSVYNCSGVNYYRQHMENVEIAYNTIQNTRLDAIQLGSCTANGSIHDNIIREYGLDDEWGQANGIQIGVGTQGAVCYNNFIHKSVPISAGHGIFCQGAGNNCIYNNIIHQTAENGIYVNESTMYDTPPGCTSLNEKGIATKIRYNTIVYQGCGGPKPNANSQAGIRLAYTSITNIYGHDLEKNLIVAKDNQTVAVKIDMSATPLENCLDNVLKSNIANLSTVFYNGTGIAAADWFRPLTFQTDIVDAATNSFCSKGCDVSSDYLGNNRIIGPYPDYGAIECTIKGDIACYYGDIANVPTLDLSSKPNKQLLIRPQISPNPFSTDFDLSFNPQISGDYFVQVLNISGQELYTSKIYLEKNTKALINLSNAIRQDTQVYLVHLVTPNGKQHSLRAIKMD